MPPCELRGFSRVDFRFSLSLWNSTLHFPCCDAKSRQKAFNTITNSARLWFYPSRIFSQACLVAFFASLSNLSSQPNGYIRAVTARRSKCLAIQMKKMVDPEGLSGLVGSWSDRKNFRPCLGLTGGGYTFVQFKGLWQIGLRRKFLKSVSRFRSCEPCTPPGCSSIAVKDPRLRRKGYILIQRDHWSRAARVA